MSNRNRNTRRDANTWPAFTGRDTRRDANTWSATHSGNAGDALLAMRAAERSRKPQKGGGLQFVPIDKHFYVKILSLVLIGVAFVLMYVPELDINKWIAGTVLIFVVSFVMMINSAVLMKTHNHYTFVEYANIIVYAVLYILAALVGGALIYAQITGKGESLTHPVIEMSIEYSPWVAGAAGIITLFSLWEKTD